MSDMLDNNYVHMHPTHGNLDKILDNTFVRPT